MPGEVMTHHEHRTRTLVIDLAVIGTVAVVLLVWLLT